MSRQETVDNKAKRVVIVCQGTGCVSSQSPLITELLEKTIAEQGLAGDIETKFSGCHGCGLSDLHDCAVDGKRLEQQVTSPLSQGFDEPESAPAGEIQNLFAGQRVIGRIREFVRYPGWVHGYSFIRFRVPRHEQGKTDEQPLTGCLFPIVNADRAADFEIFDEYLHHAGD